VCLFVPNTLFLADSSAEKFMKRLVGKTDVEDALQRLNMLTKEEDLMTAARTLGVTHDIRDDVDVIKEDTRNIDDNLKETKLGAPHPSDSSYNIDLSLRHANVAMNELQRLLFPDVTIIGRG
jgi:hypothetical protein